MRDREAPERAESGPSTEDIVEEPPVYPGESTATGEGTGAETGEGPPAGADDAGARTETETETDTEELSEDHTPRLLDGDDDEAFRARWHDIQSQFVDDPRQAVHAADALVAEVMHQLAATFADHRKNLERQWNDDKDVDTENLRMALRDYRSFFNRLLTR
ncbi:hypothetical protein ACIBG6_07725 [Streptomyces sp. NPDC050842]|uniref:hypothetical protein n=1 Tax=Streptomyces sp. NPDC050842 TaxID=3365636 RepID=UPI0037AEB3FD